MDKDYTILINREYPLPEDFIPEHLVDIGLPFDAVPGEPKRLLEEKTALSALELITRSRSEGLNLYAYPVTALTAAKKKFLQENLRLLLRDPANIRAALLWTCPVLQYKWS